MRSTGFTIVEAVVAVGIVLAMAAVAFPAFRPIFAEAHVLGAGRSFKSQFRLAASTAVRSSVYTAIRFERRGADVWYSVYQDGNQNGVRAVDITAGRDRLIAGPLPLTSGAPGVRVGFNPGVPAIPPDTGVLTGDPDPLRHVGHAVVLAPRHRDAGHVLPGRRLRAGRGARHRRHRASAADGLARREVDREAMTVVSKPN